jgi:hypothetical protein
MPPRLPEHRNPHTGEVLPNHVEVCPACFRNFASTRAGDLHRRTLEGRRVCRSPEDVGLLEFKTPRGAVVFRMPRNTYPSED